MWAIGRDSGQTVKLRFVPFRIRPVYVLLLVLLALFTYKFVQKAQEIQGLQAERAGLQYENQKTEQDNRQLRERIRHYRSIQYVGQEARAVLGYTMPGEIAIQVQPRHPVFRKAPSKPARVMPPTPIWQQWARSFFH
jgi:cell division protein FtsB